VFPDGVGVSLILQAMCAFMFRNIELYSAYSRSLLWWRKDYCELWRM